jgi:hypothetical protein
MRKTLKLAAVARLPFGPAPHFADLPKNFLHIMHSLRRRRRRLPPSIYSFPTHTAHFLPDLRRNGQISRRYRVCVHTLDCFLPEISSCVCLEGTRCRAKQPHRPGGSDDVCSTAHGRQLVAAVRWDQRSYVCPRIFPPSSAPKTRRNEAQ